jgi:hypothetical protein
MADFVPYRYIESEVTALQLTEDNQAAIIKKLSDDFKAELLSRLDIELKKPTDKVYTITFRYKADSTEQVLLPTNYLVVLSKGVIVLEEDQFNKSYVFNENPGVILGTTVLSE